MTCPVCRGLVTDPEVLRLGPPRRRYGGCPAGQPPSSELQERCPPASVPGPAHCPHAAISWTTGALCGLEAGGPEAVPSRLTQFRRGAPFTPDKSCMTLWTPWTAVCQASLSSSLHLQFATGKPQRSGWYTAWARAAQTDPCIPQLKNSEHFFITTLSISSPNASFPTIAYLA